MGKAETENALRKWKYIKRGRLELMEGLSNCDLCMKYLSRAGLAAEASCGPENCSGCPLQEHGFGCLEEDSVWHEFSELANMLDAKYQADPLFVGEQMGEGDRRVAEGVADRMIKNIEICLEALSR